MAQMSTGVLAGLALAATAVMTVGSGAAGAADGTTIVALDNAGEGAWSQPTTTVQTGDTVTWSFAGTNTHNVASSNASSLDPRWASFAYKAEYTAVTDGSSQSFTFYKHGTYTYVCELHPLAMRGEIVVTGPDREIPTAPPAPEPTPTPAPTPPAGEPQPSPPPADDHPSTPAPSRGVDTTRPAISRVKLRALRRGARVRFRLSEPATVTLSLRKGRRTVRSVRVQAAAGDRTVTVRRLRKGRYGLTVRARDAMGNRSAAKRSALRVRR